jgi:hypothetical protein
VHNTPRASRALTSNSTGNGNVELTNPFTVPSIIPAAVPLLNPNTTASAEELESLFLQFADDDAAPQHVPSEALSLESLFGDGDTDGIMELLRSIEAESSDPPSEL